MCSLGVEPDGRCVADEMHVMAAGRQLHAQFGGDDAGAAVSGIAGDSNFHVAAAWAPSLSRMSQGRTMLYHRVKGTKLRLGNALATIIAARYV